MPLLYFLRAMMADGFDANSMDVLLKDVTGNAPLLRNVDCI